jgi:hypothetical protein
VFSLLKSDRNTAWPFILARLVNLALRYVGSAPMQENVAMLLRSIEIFTTASSYDDNRVIQEAIYGYLVRKDYYGNLRRLVDARIPPLVEETTKSPTPMAETIFGMIMQPLLLITGDNEFSKNVLTNLTERFLTDSFSEQVDYFILPSLAANTNFPYSEWNKVLHQSELRRTPWLLYSFLKIGKIHLGQDKHFDVQCYLNVLSDLTVTILFVSHFSRIGSHDDDDSDDGDNNMDDVEMSDTGKRANLIGCSTVVSRSVVMLNDAEVVSSLVAATERSPEEPLALTALCRLCHNLLISDPLALHHYRLLYTLAFRPTLLHRLWNLILDTKRPSLLGSSVPLLTVYITFSIEASFIFTTEISV